MLLQWNKKYSVYNKPPTVTVLNQVKEFPGFSVKKKKDIVKIHSKYTKLTIPIYIWNGINV